MEPRVTARGGVLSALTSLFRDPLVQFLAAGGVLFIAHSATTPRRQAPGSEDARHIVVDAAFVQSASADFERATGRPMDVRERRRLVEQAIDEEILFREAKAMHLDDNDSIVRRRLVQKAEFLSDDVAPVSEPTAAELASYLDAHADAYRSPTQVSFRHLFFAFDRRGPATEGDARAAFERLTTDPRAHVVADSFLAGDAFENRSEHDIDGLLGKGAALAIAALPVGSWGPPLASPYGVHLVRVDSRHAPEVPNLAQVRNQVRQAIIDERRSENRRRTQAALRSAYVIDDRVGVRAEPLLHAMNERLP